MMQQPERIVEGFRPTFDNPRAFRLLVDRVSFGILSLSCFVFGVLPGNAVCSLVIGIRPKGCKDGEGLGIGTGLVSLSEFLDRKVGKGRGDSRFTGKIGGKAKEFSTPLHCSDGGGVCGSGVDRTAGKGDCCCGVRDEVIFKQFKRARNYKDRESCATEGDSRAGKELPSGDKQVKESTKRRDPFRGENRIPRKHVIILGYGPEHKQEQNGWIHFGNQKRRSLFNHYANGARFWYGDMEGIDGKEVECKETWEGIGSTTLGELDWN